MSDRSDAADRSAAPEPGRRRVRRRAWFVGLLLGLVAGAAATGIVTTEEWGLSRGQAAEEGGGDEGGGDEGAAEPTLASVRRGDLVDERTRQGHLRHAEEQIVLAGRVGTVTELPAEGATIELGEGLFRIDDIPRRLLHGSVPAYRTLTHGDSGSDVAQLQESLVRLGIAEDEDFEEGEFDWSLRVALQDWREETDDDVDDRRALGLGDAAFLEGSQTVLAAEARLGAHVDERTPVLRVTGGGLEVVLAVEAAERGLIEEGSTLELELPGEREATGVVDRISFRQQEDGGEAYELTLTVEDEPDGVTVGDRVDVTFVETLAEDALHVPVQALVALAEGGFAVEVARDDGAELLAVELGEFSDERVEVTPLGGDLSSEDMVIVP